MANYDILAAFNARASLGLSLSGKAVILKNQNILAEYGKPVAKQVSLNSFFVSNIQWSVEGLPFWAAIKFDGPIAIIEGTPIESPAGLSPLGVSEVKVKAENEFGVSEETISISVVGEEYIYYSGSVGVDFFFRPLNNFIVELDAGSYLPNGVSFYNGAFYGIIKNPGNWSLGLKARRAGYSEFLRSRVVLSFSRVNTLAITKKTTVSSDWFVSFEDPGVDASSNSAFACGIRYGDVVTFELIFPNNIDLRIARLAIKGVDSEPVFFATNQYDFIKASVFENNVGYKTKYLLNVNFESNALLSYLSDVENDAGTSRLGLGMFEFVINNYGQEVRHASASFAIKFTRDTIYG